MSTGFRYPAMLLLGGLMLLAAPNVGAQVIAGTIADSKTLRVIEDASIAVVDARGVEVAVATSSEGGEFSIGVEPGSYRALVRHVAYEEILSVEFDVPVDQMRVLEVLMDPAPRMLEQITVTDTQPTQAIRGRYYGRRAVGIGHFLSREDFEQRGAQVITDMLGGIPGIRVENGDFSVTRTSVARGCYPTVVLDNVVLRRRGQELGIRLDDVIRPQHIEAVEVYSRGTGLPAQYGGRESPCGAILIWSRL